MHPILALATAISTASVQGTVVEKQSHWEGGLIVTETTLHIDEVTGAGGAAVGSDVRVRQLGGTIDGVAQVAFGEDVLAGEIGERVAVRLEQEGRTWFVAASASHLDKAGETAATPGYVHATTAINNSCGTGPAIDLHWPELAAHYVIDRDAPDGVSRADAEAAIQASFNTWATLGCSYLQIDDDGEVEAPVVGFDQGGTNQNVVTFVEHGWTGKKSTQAITLLTFGCTDGVVLDADIVVNADNFRYTTHPDEDTDHRRDLQNVLTHEAGHFVGFAHSPDPLSTMFATVTADETQKRDLTDADRTGMCLTYPVDRGPLEANVTPSVVGCSIGAAGRAQANRGLLAGLTLLTIFAAAALKSRAMRPNHVRGR